jgi:membrane protease YdiL (CAAX protease family)
MGRVHVRFRAKDILLGLSASLVFLLPFCLYIFLSGRNFGYITLNTVLFQLLVVALPEEVFFRGFLQQRFGNTMKAVITVSVLFAVMHLPQFIFFADGHAILTFFPSLVMGFLYMRTDNVIPSVLFHFFANIIYSGL